MLSRDAYTIHRPFPSFYSSIPNTIPPLAFQFRQQPNVRHLCKGKYKKLLSSNNVTSQAGDAVYMIYFAYHSAKKDKYGNLIVLILLFFSCVSVSNAKTLDLMWLR
jgi:hypothetical protein